MPAPARHVVLLGLMGSGKTTVGRLLARELGRPYWDNDDELVRRLRRPLGQIVGLPTAELHRHERETLERGLAAPQPSVVAAPGSAADHRDLPALLADCVVVWLRASPGALAARVTAVAKPRPAGPDVGATLRHQATTRGDAFAAVADLVVDVDDVAPADVVGRITGAVAG